MKVYACRHYIIPVLKHALIDTAVASCEPILCILRGCYLMGHFALTVGIQCQQSYPYPCLQFTIIKITITTNTATLKGSYVENTIWLLEITLL